METNIENVATENQTAYLIASCERKNCERNPIMFKSVERNNLHRALPKSIFATMNLQLIRSQLPTPKQSAPPFSN
ncbi:MAG: hypothetical protein EBQ94_04010 [Flavobacteriales bacterium]|nr:hypothetical protein [Crocinitomicaceae bacterium]NBX79538.1 hypothetical protein [Flavobacteriales bacterium]NCA19639.1 hypothetical protein [Crocinitomicaceae bacterium]